MRHFVRWSLSGLLAAATVGLFGCTGSVGNGIGSGNGGGGPPGGGGNGNGNGAGSGGNGGGSVTLTCAPGIPATTQLRRMLNRQYDATVRDLLGVTSIGAGTTAGPPSSMLYADFDGPMVPDALRIYQDVGAAIAKAVMADPALKANFI